MDIGLLIAAAAFAVAAWQLYLQRREIVRNGRINTLLHISSMVKDRINHQEKIIEERKRNSQNWQGHAKTVNDKLRPLLRNINKSLLEIVLENAGSLRKEDLERALALEECAEENGVNG